MGAKMVSPRERGELEQITSDKNVSRKVFKLQKPIDVGRTYYGLTREKLENLLADYSASPDITPEDMAKYGVEESNRKYIHNALETMRFYAHRTYGEEKNIEADVLRNKYLAPGETGPLSLWHRQAQALAAVEETPELQEQTYYNFMEALDNFRFTPGGRIMHGAGREDIVTTLNNCYVVGIKEDSIAAIYRAVLDEAMTYKYGGGCGHDLSILRPKGDVIKKTGGESCGPTGFMDLFSVNTNTIAQHGRRGANMQTLRVDHPDIEHFIRIKGGDLNIVRYSNISTLITNEFMNAVENDSDFDLRWGGNIYRTVKARDLWNDIITQAHKSAEPGLLFWDTMRDYHNGEYVNPLSSTNPCAEEPLPDGGCCNLGSINLEKFVDSDGKFMKEEFMRTTRIATRFLDNIVDYNIDRHALNIQRENAKNDRRVGLGILGLGDALIRMGKKYDSEEALETVDGIMRTFRDTAYKTSIELAEEKGIFPNFAWGGYSQSKFVQELSTDMQEQIKEKGIRNVTVLTVAPTGSGAIVAQVTSGIEPVFATKYQRRVKNQKGGSDDFKEYTVCHPVIQELFGEGEIPDHVVTAHEIDPHFRVRMQGVIQKYIDSSISSTINLPENISVDAVAKIYEDAHKQGLKGVTVYREGSREGIMKTQKGSLEKRVRDLSVPKHPFLKIGFDDERYIFSDKYEIQTGLGALHISVTTDYRGFPMEVFANMGPPGSSHSSSINLTGLRLSRYLQQTIRPKLLQITKDFGSIKSDKPLGIAESTIDSIEHGLSIAIKYHLESYRIIGKKDGFLIEKEFKIRDAEFEDVLVAHESGLEKNVGEQRSSSSLDENALNRGIHNNNVCEECGGRIKYESGCSMCLDCGDEKCGG